MAWPVGKIQSPAVFFIKTENVFIKTENVGLYYDYLIAESYDNLIAESLF